jgi:hypothetical protein
MGALSNARPSGEAGADGRPIVKNNMAKAEQR